MSDERRQAQRYRTLKGAHIVFNRGGSSINCVVRNLSENDQHRAARVSECLRLAAREPFDLEA